MVKPAKLISAQSLHDQFDDPRLRVIDSTAFLRREVPDGPYTVESGRQSYEKAHIPGAVFADIPAALSDPNSPFRFSLPSAELFASAIGDLGVGDTTWVVAYAQETPMWATRLWWLFSYFGYDNVSVLDGGLTAWRQSGFELSSAPVSVEKASFTAVPRPELVASRDDIIEFVGGKTACLVNALTPQAFKGLGAYAYSRPGRIPGSLNIPAQQLLDPDTWCFRPKEELAKLLSPLLAEDLAVPLIAYCGGGISATVDIFALSLLGRSDVVLYDGSLTEWSADPTLPLEVG